MAGKVLRIDIELDESGKARRAASELDAGLKQVATTASGTTQQAIDRINSKFADTEVAIIKADSAVKTLTANNRAHEAEMKRSEAALDSLTRMVGAYISVNAVWGAITSTAAWGSELEGLSKRLKIPVDDLQRLSYAAQQNGVTLNDVGGAIGMLEQRIGDENTGAAGALVQLGIGMQDIRSKDPMSLFLAIGDSVAKIKDPYEQAQRVQALFGREGNELLPLLTGNLRDLMDQADKVGAVMSPGLAKAAADADNAFANMRTTGKVLIAEVLQPILPLLTAVANQDFKGFGAGLRDLFVEGTRNVINFRDALTGLNYVTTGDVGAIPDLPGSPKKPVGAGLDSDPGGLFNKKTGLAQDSGLVKELNDAVRSSIELNEASIRLDKQWADMWSHMHKEAVKAIDGYTASFMKSQEVMAAASGKSLAVVLKTFESSKERLDQLYAGTGPRGLEAELDTLTKKHQADVAELMAAARNAPEGSKLVAQTVENLNSIYDREFADLLMKAGTLTTTIGDIGSASTDMSGAMSAGLDGVRGKTEQLTQGFIQMGTASKQSLADGLNALDQAYRDAGFFIQINGDVSKLRIAQTGGLAFAGGGYVDTHYLARGGPAGTDTVPAMLTPGEGVLSRTGMSALDRLNAGGAVGRGGGVTVVIERGAIDARGAQFADEDSLRLLVEKLQLRLATIGEGVGQQS